jgi:membrane associated rhomboid family serine protease
VGVQSPIRLPSSGDPATSRRRLPTLDSTSWSGALILMVLVGAGLWIVQFVNASDNYGLDRFGLRPRRVDGLWGIVTEPFLHASYDHLLSNTLPLVLIGWVLMVSGLRTWLLVTAFVVGGVLTWLIGPSNTVIVGASGMIFGWLGYLLARAVFSRKLKWIITAVLVLSIFGTLLVGLFPTLHSNVSWQAHLCGFVAGIGAGALLHPRGGDTRFTKRPAVS